jgi:hypothetical protein
MSGLRSSVFTLWGARRTAKNGDAAGARKERQLPDAKGAKNYNSKNFELTARRGGTVPDIVLPSRAWLSSRYFAIFASDLCSGSAVRITGG